MKALACCLAALALLGACAENRRQRLQALAGRTVQGAFASAILPVATAALAKIPDTEERARKVAGLGAASLLGFFAAPALSASAVSVLAGDAVAMVLSASGLVALAALAIVVVMLSRAPERSGELAVEKERPLPRRFLALNLLAYYLDIPRDEQRRRLAERARDPLTQWKSSPIDARALKRWKDYTRARDAMLQRTHSAFDILDRLHYDGKKERLLAPDARVVFAFEEACLLDGRLAR